MAEKLRWGCLGAAQFALTKFLPAIPACQYAELAAIASRDSAKAHKAAKKLGIPKAYGSYEELLADPEIDVVYNPLPNHLHLEWTVRAAAAGKHVLCEKPIGLSVAEVDEMIAARDRHKVKIGEAFMVHTHPQWVRARELVRQGALGELRAVTGFFSYYNRDPKNIRNIPEAGGGGLYDIGCYTIHLSRFLFGEEPVRVAAVIECDPEFGTDRLTSAVLEYPSGQCIWTVSTQLVPYQRMQAFGTKARLEVQIPFNAPKDRPARIFIDEGGDLTGATIRTEEFPVCDQYTIEVDAFSKAVLEDREVPVPLEDARANMAVIEAVFRAARSGKWEPV